MQDTEGKVHLEEEELGEVEEGTGLGEARRQGEGLRFPVSGFVERNHSDALCWMV